jgi:hypothetical protein
MTSPIDRRLLGCVALAIACRKAPPMTTDNPSDAPGSIATDAAVSTGPADAAPPATVGLPDLGTSFKETTISPGRYATAIQRTQKGTHAAQLLVEDSTTSFVLELGVDGTATVCRGWRHDFRNSGPKVKTEERFREQRGYRGTYVVRAGVAEIEMTSDESVCASKEEASQKLTRAPSLKLRCVMVTPHDHPLVKRPVLLCQWLDASTSEPAALLVPEVAPEGWIALGPDPGLLIRISGRPGGAQAGPPRQVAVELSREPLRGDAWEQPF